jgi:hypothetical protein
MFGLRKKHLHQFMEIGKYYHVYDNSKSGYNPISSIKTAFGTHVEVNSLMVCKICGESEIENHSTKIIQEEFDSFMNNDYIKQLELDNVLSEGKMEEKYSTMLKNIKNVNLK